ncbi:MAG: ABC transporter permease [Anaplasmataceae bacterium]|nr:ABC transporter permease [Anaplasmataceae bacterium]
MNCVQYLGKNVIKFTGTIGIITIFMLNILISFGDFLKNFKKHLMSTLKHLYEIGFSSASIIALIITTTGAVMALQSYIGFNQLQSNFIILKIVVFSITRELGPVLVGLIIAGRSASAIAAEISAMKISEQIDSLRTLSINIYSYLFLTRIIASIIALPFLVFIADCFGIMGGTIIAHNVIQVDINSCINYVIEAFQYKDFISGIYKAFFFGFIIAFISCFYGFNCNKGSEGVGEATTKAVVSSFIFIMIANYILTQLFFNI